MTPEADRFLQKANKHLERGHTMLGVGLNDDAGRAAYLAAFHAAQAVIFERTGKVTKTHGGVQSEFLSLTIADCETGSGVEVSAEKATAAVDGRVSLSMPSAKC